MRYFLAGHRGLVGSALLRKLEARGDCVVTRTRSELDLTDQSAVRSFMRIERPDIVILAAAKVGGILANRDFPADFIYQNMAIEANLIHEAFAAGVKRLLFLGSTCIYPKITPQPIPESALLTGSLEPTNEPYAIAKIAGMKLCEAYNRQHGTDFRTIMPTNLYGPGDNFDLQSSHVLPALLRRFHEGKISGQKQLIVWGTGTPRREFLHVDDMADASLFVLDLDPHIYLSNTLPMQSHVNVGSGEDIAIADLAKVLARVTGYSGEILFDHTKPDGTPRRLLDVTLINSLGWKSKVNLERGIEDTYAWYVGKTNNTFGIRQSVG